MRTDHRSSYRHQSTFHNIIIIRNHSFIQHSFCPIVVIINRHSFSCVVHHHHHYHHHYCQPQPFLKFFLVIPSNAIHSFIHHHIHHITSCSSIFFICENVFPFLDFDLPPHSQSFWFHSTVFHTTILFPP